MDLLLALEGTGLDYLCWIVLRRKALFLYALETYLLNCSIPYLLRSIRPRKIVAGLLPGASSNSSKEYSWRGLAFVRGDNLALWGDLGWTTGLPFFILGYAG
jgi:hypothetical protein